MSINPYFNPSGAPATSSEVTSAVIRAEFVAVAAGFSLLPPLPLTANTAVVVNSAGTGFAITGGLSIAGSFATTGAFTTTLAQVASVVLTLPAVNGTLATLAGNETLFNKTLVTPALGVPSSGDLSNCTGVAPGLTAGTVQTLPNLTGPITSAGTVTSLGAQSGTGSVIVVQNSPTLVTPILGVATVTTINGLAITSTSAAHLVIASSKTLTVSNTLTLAAAADGQTFTFPSTSDTVATANNTLTLTNKTLTAAVLGSSTATTQPFETNNTTVATTAYVDTAIPAGVILPYGGSSAPTGYALCFGQALSRTTFAALFAAIGTAYGIGDGSTTFNVPDLRGRVPAGLDNMGGSAASRLTATTMSPNGTTLGATGGGQTNTTTTTSTYAGGAGQTAGAWSGSAPAAAGADFNALTTSSISSVNLGSIVVAGNSAAFVIVQPTLLTNYIIKT